MVDLGDAGGRRHSRLRRHAGGHHQDRAALGLDHRHRIDREMTMHGIRPRTSWRGRWNKRARERDAGLGRWTRSGDRAGDRDPRGPAGGWIRGRHLLPEAFPSVRRPARPARSGAAAVLALPERRNPSGVAARAPRVYPSAVLDTRSAETTSRPSRTRSLIATASVDVGHRRWSR